MLFFSVLAIASLLFPIAALGSITEYSSVGTDSSNQSIFTIGYDQSAYLLADGHRYRGDRGENDDDENEAMEEAGEAIGFGALAFVLGAGLLYPARRAFPATTRLFPASKTLFAKLLRQMKKWHVTAGILALVLSAVHGVFMFFAEGELEAHEWLGIFAEFLFLFGFLWGLGLLRLKKSPLMRSFHKTLMIGAVLLVIVHVVFS